MAHVIGIMREEAGHFRLGFPDFPGLSAEGDSLEAAMGRAAEALGERLRADGGAPPRLKSVDALAAEEPARLSQGALVLVPLPAVAGRGDGDAPEQALPGDVPPSTGQVPLSGRLAATEAPSARAKAKAEAEIPAGQGKSAG